MTDELDDGQEIKAEEEEYWLGNLMVGAPQLDPFVEFVPQCTSQPVGLKKANFKRDLQEFVDRVQPTSLPSSVVESLYQCAVSDLTYVAAWKETKQIADSQKFKQWGRYTRQERDRYSKIFTMLRKSLKEKPPSWTSEWNKAWVGAVGTLCQRILEEFSFYHLHSQQFSRIRALGRTNVQTHLLLGAKEFIRGVAKESRRKTVGKRKRLGRIDVLVAAYAYASGLVPKRRAKRGNTDNSAFENYMTAINMRISRASKSKEKGYVSVMMKLYPPRETAVEWRLSNKSKAAG